MINCEKEIKFHSLVAYKQHLRVVDVEQHGYLDHVSYSIFT